MTIQFSIDQIDEVARRFLQEIGDEKVFAFYGDLGAGKTTFIKSVCGRLGVDSPVNSPTFAIINEYGSPNGPVYHFDFYRIKQPSEAYDIGCEDYFYSGQYCFIEWPEKLENLLPECREVRLSVLPDGKREMSF